MGPDPVRFDETLHQRALANVRAFDRRSAAIDGHRPAAVAVVLLPDDAGRACFLLTRRAASHPFERSVRRFLDAVRDHDPAAVACTPPDAAATLAVAIAAEQALRTSRAVQVGTF